MVELIRANDIVLIGFARSLLEDAGIPVLVADEHMSAMEGSIGMFGRRLLVPDDHAAQARPHPQGCRARARIAGAVSEADAFLGGRLRLRQPPRGAHRAGTDGVLLARLLAAEPGERLCDLGSGPASSASPARSCGRASAFTLVERDPALADLARANAALNGVAAEVIEADVLAPGREREAAGLTPDRFDCVLTNPPFFEEGRYRPSPDAAKASAHGFPAEVSTADPHLRGHPAAGRAARDDPGPTPCPAASRRWPVASAGSRCGPSTRNRRSRRSASSFSAVKGAGHPSPSRRPSSCTGRTGASPPRPTPPPLREPAPKRALLLHRTLR